MGTWQSYSLSDLLLFSPRVYHRLFELLNETAWPLQILCAALGIGIATAIARPRQNHLRIAFASLGLIWLWLAWFFFWTHYATINWAANWIAPLIAAQGLALMVISTLGSPRRKEIEPADNMQTIGALLIAAATLGYPLLPLADGRPLAQAEVFGLAPDPTAIATLLALAVARPRGFQPAMVIPALWCSMTGVTLWTLQHWAYWIPPAVAIAALAIAFVPPQRAN